jgi:hypothetical protein
MEVFQSQLRLNNISVGEYFLYDLQNKIVVNTDYFVEMIPIYNARNAIFTIMYEKDTYDPAVRYLSDTSENGILQFISILLARRDMMMPASHMWSDSGKKLLTYLIATKYKMGVIFNSPASGSDAVDYTFVSEIKQQNTSLANFNIKRSLELAGKIKSEPDDSEGFASNYLLNSPKDDDEVFFTDRTDEQCTMLSYFAEKGAAHFCNGGYAATVDTIIDMLADVYSRVTLNTRTGVLTVKLCPGQENRTYAKMAEELSIEEECITVLSNVVEG